MLVVTIIVSAACGVYFASLISAAPNPFTQREGEPLEKKWWVVVVVAFVTTNVVLVSLGFPVLTGLLMVALLAYLIFFIKDKLTANLGITTMLSLAASFALCAAQRIDRLNTANKPVSTGSKLGIILVPILAIALTFLISLVKAISDDRKHKLKNTLTTSNIITTLVVVAMVIIVIICLKEVF